MTYTCWDKYSLWCGEQQVKHFGLFLDYIFKIQGMSTLLSGDDCGDQVQAEIFFFLGYLKGFEKSLGFKYVKNWDPVRI